MFTLVWQLCIDWMWFVYDPWNRNAGNTVIIPNRHRAGWFDKHCSIACHYNNDIWEATDLRWGVPNHFSSFIVFRDEICHGIFHMYYMDNTVIPATSSERLIEKLYILHGFCESHGMIINENKTKFIVIHDGVHERMLIKINWRVIQHCDKYIYLGCVFTSDGSTKSSLCAQVADWQKHSWKQGSWGQYGAHLGPTGPRWAPCWPHEFAIWDYNKLVSFLRNNCDMPFVMKWDEFVKWHEFVECRTIIWIWELARY